MWPFIIFFVVYMFTQSQCNLLDLLEERSYLLERELAMMVGSEIKLSDSELKANEIIMKLKNDEIEHGFIYPNQFNLSKHFFEYKDEIKKTKLFQIIQSMPKGAVLHAHDTGLLSPDYVLALTYRKNLWFCWKKGEPNIDFYFSKTTPINPCVTGWELMEEARNASGDIAKFDADLRKHFTIVIDNPNKIYTDVNAVWQKFQQCFINTGNLFDYKPVYEQYYYDTLLEFRKDQVMYLELRSTLSNLYDLDGNVYDAVETAATYKRVTEKFMKDYPDFFGMKLIYAPLKLVDKATVQEYVRILLQVKKLMPEFLVGFDLVGQEDVGVPLREFIDELAEVRENVDLYLHAGETNWYGTSSDENLFDAIALDAKRIGHAFALIKHPLLMEEVKKRQIGLEVNVVSNSVLKLVEDPRNHPLATFLSQNMPVLISSDDPGIWEALPMSHDFYVTFVAVASRHADLKLMKQLALNSLYYSSYPEKHKLVHAFEIRWTKFIDAIVKDKW